VPSSIISRTPPFSLSPSQGDQLHTRATVEVLCSRSALDLEGKRVVLVRDSPASPLLAQPKSRTQAILRLRLQFSLGPAAEQGLRECDVVSCRDLQRHDLEDPTALLKLERALSFPRTSTSASTSRRASSAL
jgi:hypothetical protein